MNRLFFLLWLFSCTLMAAEQEVQVFWYEELEQGLSPTVYRYLISDRFLRIDSGKLEDHYILFDTTKNTIFSVNHDDQTILTIVSKPWVLPEFDFQRRQLSNPVKGAPKLFDKTVNRYQLFAGDKLCTDIQLVPEIQAQSRAMLRKYQTVLSGQQVQSLFNTPEDMRSPCFLIDQVYNTGDYYDQGLPVQEWHSRGYARILKDIQKITVDDKLFSLPKDYQSFSPVAQEYLKE